MLEHWSLVSRTYCPILIDDSRVKNLPVYRDDNDTDRLAAFDKFEEALYEVESESDLIRLPQSQPE